MQRLGGPRRTACMCSPHLGGDDTIVRTRTLVPLQPFGPRPSQSLASNHIAINSTQTAANSGEDDKPRTQLSRAFRKLQQVPAKLGEVTENQGVGGSIRCLFTFPEPDLRLASSSLLGQFLLQG